MSYLDTYQKIRKYLHVSDNSLRDLDGNKENKLWKISPIIEHVRANCMKIESQPNHSIDEQIVPAKMRFSGICQYNPKKPTKWGFKNFVRAGRSGIMYGFFFYNGANIVGSQKCNGPFVVNKFIESLPKYLNHMIIFRQLVLYIRPLYRSKTFRYTKSSYYQIQSNERLSVTK